MEKNNDNIACCSADSQLLGHRLLRRSMRRVPRKVDELVRHYLELTASLVRNETECQLRP